MQKLIFKFSGGLGNQLYEYIMLKQLENIYGCSKILIDINDYQRGTIHQGFELVRIFGEGVLENFLEADKRDSIFLGGSMPYHKRIQHRITDYSNVILRRIYHPKFRIDEDEVVNGYKCEDDKVLFIREKIQSLADMKCVYLSGFWTDPLYYPDGLEGVSSMLKFPPFDDAENTKISDFINSTNSVSVHLRRGDYVCSSYDVLTKEYYQKAVDYMKWHIGKELTWFIFSDDLVYAKEFFGWLDNSVFISHNKGLASYRDMQLMSMCKHNIVANSTFSEWGAIFNTNVDKIVIYPALYEKDRINREKHWNRWVRI